MSVLPICVVSTGKVYQFIVKLTVHILRVYLRKHGSSTAYLTFPYFGKSCTDHLLNIQSISCIQFNYKTKLSAVSIRLTTLKLLIISGY